MSPPLENNGEENDGIKKIGLGLSLRLETNSTSEAEDHQQEYKNKESLQKLTSLESLSSSLSLQNQIPRTILHHHHESPGITNAGHVASSSPPNRKARVSVRARCESATVSILIHFIHLNTSPFFLLKS